jgi:hypothetical protein
MVLLFLCQSYLQIEDIAIFDLEGKHHAQRVTLNFQLKKIKNNINKTICFTKMLFLQFS